MKQQFYFLKQQTYFCHLEHEFEITYYTFLEVRL